MPFITPARAAFRDRAIRLARKIAPLYRLDWRFLASAAILESAWGESDNARDRHDYFNLLPAPAPSGAPAPAPSPAPAPAPSGAFRDLADAFHAFARLVASAGNFTAARTARENAGNTKCGAFFDIECACAARVHPDPDHHSKLRQIAAMLKPPREVRHAQSAR